MNNEQNAIFLKKHFHIKVQLIPKKEFLITKYEYILHKISFTS